MKVVANHCPAEAAFPNPLLRCWAILTSISSHLRLFFIENQNPQNVRISCYLKSLLLFKRLLLFFSLKMWTLFIIFFCGISFSFCFLILKRRSRQHRALIAVHNLFSEDWREGVWCLLTADAMNERLATAYLSADVNELFKLAAEVLPLLHHWALDRVPFHPSANGAFKFSFSACTYFELSTGILSHNIT